MPLSQEESPGRAVRTIRRRLVWGVIALQASLQLGWIVYGAYQPVLLQRFGFTGLVFTFGLLPGLIGLVIEPLSGALSDRRSDRSRGRLLPVTVAVSVAGLLFLATAGLLQRAPAGIGVVLPALMLLWMVAAQAAASPNLAQLNEAVPLRHLPGAVALLTLTQGLIGAFSGSLAGGALRLGPSFAFLLGGLVLALGLAVLRAGQQWPPGRPVATGTAAPAPASPAAAASQPRRPPGAKAATGALLLIVALAAGTQMQLLLELLPRLEPAAAAGLPQDALAPVVLFCSALGAPLGGRAVGRWGRIPSLITGILLLALALCASLLLPDPSALLLLPLLGLIHSLVATSLTATALAALAPGASGLGAGLALGGTAMAGSLRLLRFGAAGPVGRPGLLSLLAAASAAALVGSLLLERQQRRSPEPGARA